MKAKPCNDRLIIGGLLTLAVVTIVGALALVFLGKSAPEQVLIVPSSTVTGLLGFLGGRAGRSLNTGPTDTVNIEEAKP